MKLPQKAVIGAYNFTIELNEERINAQRVREEDPNLVGHIDYAAQRISMCPKLGPDALADTLMHEIDHGILMVSGINLDSDLEEKIVSAMSPLQLLTLRNNPELVAFWTNNDRTSTRGSKSPRKT